MTIGIIGTGTVGGAAANALVLRGIAEEIVLVDQSAARAVAAAEDVLHATPFAGNCRVRAGAHADLGGAAGRVLGTGTILDTARFRARLAGYLGVAVQSVHAHVIGEHGDSEILCWSSATIGGVPAACLAEEIGRPLTSAARAVIDDDVRRAAYRIIEGKGATWYGIGSGIARICHVIDHDENAVLTLSITSELEGGAPVALSLPRVIGRTGVTRTLDAELETSERRALDHSAAVLRAAMGDRWS